MRFMMYKGLRQNNGSNFRFFLSLLWPSDFTFLPLWVLSPFPISLVSIDITGPPCIYHIAKVSIYYGHSKIQCSHSCHDNCQYVLIVKYYALRSVGEENLLYISSFASSTYFVIAACYLICLSISFIIYSIELTLLCTS